MRSSFIRRASKGREREKKKKEEKKREKREPELENFILQELYFVV